MSKYEPSNTQLPHHIDLPGTANALAVRDEFREGYDTVPTFENPISRRSFMALLSASMAVTAAACRRPNHKLVPSVKSPEYIIPGLPNHYATVYMHKNAAQSLLVKVREGRPVKVDGNDMHPISGGKSGVLVQGTLMNLYDPDRIRQITVGRTPEKPKTGGFSTPQNAVNMIVAGINSAKNSGKETRILIDEHCSPSFDALCKEIEQANPNIAFVIVPNTICDGAAEANKALYGMDAEFVADLSKASCIVSVDQDFLGTDKNSTWHTRNFAAGRKPSKESPAMTKLTVAEATFSLTGMNADERVKLSANDFEAFLATLHNEVAAKRGGARISGYSDTQAEAAKRCAAELCEAGEKGCVLVGAHLSPMANGIGMAINSMLGSVGSGKVFANTLPNSNTKMPGVEKLRSDIRAGKVGVVLFCDVNPMFCADADLRSLLGAVQEKYSSTYYDDETAAYTTINMPSAHQYESWGDAVTFDGTLSLQQPLIAPLNEGSMSNADLLMSIAKGLNAASFASAASYYEYVKARWMNVVHDDAGWEKALRDGAVAQPLTASVNAANTANLAGLTKAKKIEGMALLTTLSSTIYDGMFANNGWMMECPDPITKHTWENVAMMSKNTAAKLGAIADHVVKVDNGDRDAIELPVLIQPGLSDDIIVTCVGFGREFGEIAKGYGTNAYRLLKQGTSIGYSEVKVTTVDKKNTVARTQGYFHTQHAKGTEWDPHAPESKTRDIVRDMTLAQVKSGEIITKQEEIVGDKIGGDKFVTPMSLMSGYQYKGHRWGMVIDMSTCTGCNACVIACQSENNIATVGKEQVIRGREMHWMRLDLYYKGDPENPESIVEPMLCQHCESAPCENVCPVAATTHSPEGLNEMTYNRCVGTRYCLNNCPYKVRRFNFLDFRERLTGDKQPMDYVFNPDVTVRVRGVMEKCTFCVQRINEAKYHAKDRGFSRVPDGDLVTACQEACPASAITFGNMNDPESKVSKLKQGQRSFKVLEELNVRPSITYLAKVRNKQAEA